MPTITINRNEFENYVGKKLPTDKLKDRISFLGTDLEEVNDKEIVVEVFPNRPDMLSVQGFARAFSSFIGEKTGLKKYEAKKPTHKVIITKDVASVRPYTACAIVTGLKFSDEKIKEVIDIQEKLHVTYGRNRKKAAIGIYPFEKIKTPITYTALPPKDIVFRPLEFPKEINAVQVIEQHSAGKEYGHLLEGQKTFPVFLDADKNVLSVPPLINSHETGRINEKTTDVFIECSGHDLNVLKKCLNIIVAALADMGGIIHAMELQYDKKIVTPDLTPREIPMDVTYLNKLLGLDLKEHDAKQLLEKMGFGYHNKKVQIPVYRADILHQIDLSEDIAIAYGYENFEPTIPKVATVAQEAPFEIFKTKIRDVLTGLGLLETSTYHLTNKEHQATKMNHDPKPITLANSISEEYDALQAWVLPSLMNILSQNKHHEYPQLIYSISRIFKKGSSETGIIEHDRLAVVQCGEGITYTHARQLIDYLLRSLDVTYTVSSTKHDSFIEGRVARIAVKGKNVAYIGEIHPQVLESWDIPTSVAAMELNLSELFEAINNKK